MIGVDLQIKVILSRESVGEIFGKYRTRGLSVNSRNLIINVFNNQGLHQLFESICNDTQQIDSCPVESKSFKIGSG